VKVGNIYWVELPPAGGHEQKGRRPVIVVQDEDYAAGLPVVLVVPLSTSRRSMRFAGTVLIKATKMSGLRIDSVALVFQLRTIDRNRIRNKLGAISSNELHQIFLELDKLMGRNA